MCAWDEGTDTDDSWLAEIHEPIGYLATQIAISTSVLPAQEGVEL